MAKMTMYPAINNSPTAVLSASITADAKELTVDDITKLPEAPNILTIGTDSDAELVLYTTKSGSKISGLTRGFNGTVAKTWDSGTMVYRAYTAYDHDSFMANIKELERSSATKQDKGSSGYLAQFDGTGNPISSEKKVSDFATSEQGKKADSSVQSVKFGEAALSKDVAGAVAIPTNKAGGAVVLDENGLIAPAYIPGLLVHRWGVLVPADSSAVCTRLYEAEGMVANAHKGSFNQNLRNDFDDVFLMAGMKDTIGYDIEKKKVIASSTDGTLARDGSSGDIFKRKPAHYRMRKKLADGSEIRAFADGPLPGYEYVPEVLYPVYLASAYDSTAESNNGTGKLRSVRGTVPLTEVSLQNFQTKATNTGCSILDVTHASDLADMMLIEFANRNMQTAIGNGISSHNYTGYPVQNTGSANYVVLTNAQAANFNKEYCTVTISKTSSGAHDLAWCRKITAITDMGDGNSKIEFDGAAVTLVEGAYAKASKNLLGQADGILVGSGYIGTDGKSSVCYRGIQDVYGHVFQGLLGLLKLGTHPPKYYFCDDPTKYAMSVTADYREIGECNIDAEGYVKSVLYNETAPFATSLIADEVGASSATYWCDYVWRNAKPDAEESSRLRVPFLGGTWGDGSGGGPWFVSWSYAPSWSAWLYGARLLVTPPWGVRGA